MLPKSQSPQKDSGLLNSISYHSKRKKKKKRKKERDTERNFAKKRKSGTDEVSLEFVFPSLSHAI
jgi:hypothetical protein